MALRSRILVVAEDVQTRRYLEVRLHGRGYRTIFATDEQTAVAAIRREHPRLVLVDMSMPRHKGVHVLERLSEGSLSSVPVVALVGSGESSMGETEPELVETIESALASSSLAA